MRIAILHNFYRSSVPSGENEVVQREFESLIESGISSRLVKLESDSFLNMKFNQKLQLFFRKILFGRDSISESDWTEIYRSDVIHIHNTFPLIGYDILKKVKKLSIPTVLTIHNARLSCINGTHLYRNQSCFSCSRFKSSLPGIFRRCYGNSFWQSFAFSLYMRKLRKNFRFVEKFFVLNTYTRSHLLRMGIEEHRIVQKVTPTAINLMGEVSSENIVFYAGRISEEKGINLLLKSWVNSELYKNGWKLYVAGSGNLEKVIEWRELVSFGIVHLGKIGPLEVEKFVRKSKLIVVPSLGYEGFPSMISLASSYGKRIFVTNAEYFQQFSDLPWINLVAANTNAWTLAFNSLLELVDDFRSEVAILWWKKNASNDSNLSTLMSTYKEVVDNVE